MYEFLSKYEEIISENLINNKDLISRIDKIMNNIRDHINKLNPEVFKARMRLILAIKLVESFRILEWIKVCLYCGSYHSVYKELRYLIDSMTQAFYIDTKLPSAQLHAKLEAYKIFDENSKFDFIGKNLINAVDGMPAQSQLREYYGYLSKYIHPSYKQTIESMEKAKDKQVWDRMKQNIYDKKMLEDCIEKCESIIECFLEINKKFEKFYLKHLENPNPL